MCLCSTSKTRGGDGRAYKIKDTIFIVSLVSQKQKEDLATCRRQNYRNYDHVECSVVELLVK